MLFVAAAARPNAVMTAAWTFSESQRAHAVAGENLEGTASKLSNIGLRLGVYSPEQAITAEFKQAFRIGPPGAQTENNVLFEHNVLYRRRSS
jgi:hypothetical protein